MSRRLRLSTLSNEEESLSELWEWRELQRALINAERARLFAALERGESLAEPRYFAKTKEELDSNFAFQSTETDLLSMLGMFACVEASLRVDFVKRITYRRKDDVSRKFRAADKARAKQIRLEEDVLDVWQAQPIAGIYRAVSDFKGALKLRHWLAQGRYWNAKLGRASGYNALDVFEICNRLLCSVAAYAG